MSSLSSPERIKFVQLSGVYVDSLAQLSRAYGVCSALWSVYLEEVEKLVQLSGAKFVLTRAFVHMTCMCWLAATSSPPGREQVIRPPTTSLSLTYHH